MSGLTPFRGRIRNAPIPTRTLYRFEKPGGHWAEVRERTIAEFEALEFVIYMDGSLLESEMFHGPRLAAYPAALQARLKQFSDGGWQPVKVPDDPIV